VNITAKIRDELLGCNICDNTSNVIITTIYSEGPRVKEMSGECGRDTKPRQRPLPMDYQQFTAKIRDELLGCNIFDNTSNVILTVIYLEGPRVKEMSGECGRDTKPR
jgi:hypothetical protein